LVAASLAAEPANGQYCVDGTQDVLGCGPDNDGGLTELCNPEDPLIPDPADTDPCAIDADCDNNECAAGVCSIPNPDYDAGDNDTVGCGPDNDGGDPALCCSVMTTSPYWIGLYDNHSTQIDPPGLWIWIGDRTNVAGNGGNSLWMSGFPNDIDNDTDTPGQADCGAMIGADNSGTTGEWNDLPCNQQLRFVCEFPLEQSP
jgi:hypothetical protein